MNRKYLILAIAFLIAALYGVSLFIMKDFDIKAVVPTIAFAAISYFFFSNLKEQE